MIGNSIGICTYSKSIRRTLAAAESHSRKHRQPRNPGYKAVKVSFEEALETKLNVLAPLLCLTDRETMTPYVHSKLQDPISNRPVRFGTSDGNNVNLESENIDMAKTQNSISVI